MAGEEIISPVHVLSMIAKIVFYIVLISILGTNIIVVFMPFMGIISEKWDIGVLKPMVDHTPMWGRFIMSFLALSLWVIAIKKGKFKNIMKGLKTICFYSISYILIGGILSGLLVEYAPRNNFIAYPLTALIFGFPIFYLIYLFIKESKDKKVDKFPTKNKSSSAENFIFKTKLGNIILDNPFRGIYIQGGAGSGKSASIFEPIIKQIAEQNYTGILYDFKSPELTNKVRASYSESNINFKNVDFKNPHQSDRINPIAPKYLTKSVIAIEYSQALVNNLIPESIKKADFWSNNAKMIIAGVIWWLKEEHPKYCTLPHAISLLLHTDIKLLLLKISQNYEAGGMVTSLRQSLENEAQNQVAGILSTIQTALSSLNTKDVFWLLSADDVDLELNSPENPSFLCLGNDSTLPKVYAPIISLIISVGVRQMNRPDRLKSVVLLDEAPTIFIPNIEQIPATARSNKIATIFGVQDFSQLVDNYGQDKAQIIISNLGNQFFGRVTNGKTAEMVKTLFSKEDRLFTNKNTGSGTSGKFVHMQSNESTGNSETTQERDRVRVADLINLEPGQFYGIIAEGTPKEFLNTQFLEDLVKGKESEKASISDREMSDNYFRIIQQSKNLLE
jgi:hypothetical protein